MGSSSNLAPFERGSLDETWRTTAQPNNQAAQQPRRGIARPFSKSPHCNFCTRTRWMVSSQLTLRSDLPCSSRSLTHTPPQATTARAVPSSDRSDHNWTLFGNNSQASPRPQASWRVFALCSLHLALKLLPIQQAGTSSVQHLHDSCE